MKLSLKKQISSFYIFLHGWKNFLTLLNALFILTLLQNQCWSQYAESSLDLGKPNENPAALAQNLQKYFIKGGGNITTSESDRNVFSHTYENRDSTSTSLLTSVCLSNLFFELFSTLNKRENISEKSSGGSSTLNNSIQMKNFLTNGSLKMDNHALGIQFKYQESSLNLSLTKTTQFGLGLASQLFKKITIGPFWKYSIEENNYKIKNSWSEIGLGADLYSELRSSFTWKIGAFATYSPESISSNNELQIGTSYHEKTTLYGLRLETLVEVPAFLSINNLYFGIQRQEITRSGIKKNNTNTINSDESSESESSWQGDIYFLLLNTKLQIGPNFEKVTITRGNQTSNENKTGLTLVLKI